MASIFGKFKGSSAPNTPLTGSTSGKKGVAQTPSTPLEKWLAETNTSEEHGGDKFFGMHNASNTCYCNSIVQCLYYTEPFREQIINFPRQGPKHSSIENNANGVAPGNEASSKDNATGMSPAATNGARTQDQASDSALPKKGTPTLNPTPNPQQENKESFDYQKKLALNAGPHIRIDKGYAQAYGMQESLFTGLKDLFEGIVNSESRTGIVHPTKILELLREKNEMFRSANHQDAHEFFLTLLNDIVEQVEEYVKAHPEAAGAATGLGLSAASLPPPSKQDNKTPNTWVHDILRSTLTSETRCLTCENVSQVDEPYFELSVALEAHSSVTSCLSTFSAEEMLCETNKFRCDTCCGLQEAEKRMKVKRLPKILILHLKRFEYTLTGTPVKKLFHRVNYPFHLRLFNTTDDAQDPDRLYELYAVVVHLGSSPFHGHYVSIIKSKDRGWLLFDDELVLPVEKEYVRNFFGGDPKNPACAYVLFYQQTTIEAVQREQETEADLPSPSVAPPPENTAEMSGIIDGDEEPSSPVIHAQTTATPAFEDADPLAGLNPVTSAPAAPLSASQDREPASLGAVLERAPSADESRPLSSNTKSPTSASKSGTFNRFKNSSLSLRSKSKLWSSKDKSQDPALEENAQEENDLQREAMAPAATAFEKAEKEKPKVGRFSLGKKKPTP